GDDPQQVVAQLARAITNKLIHAPTTGLKKASAEGRHDVLGHAARLLGLDASQDEQTSLPDLLAIDSETESESPRTPGPTLQ
ncbi:MAG: glutamyl-tRNA reductase, partial [Congregibacter sp.]|nr:glutamyl-tRNA reductase [Congregibacter sp.]